MWGDGRVSTSGRTNECLGIWCVMWCPCLASEAWKLEHYTLGVPWVVLQCLITKKSAIIKLANQLLENVRDLNFPINHIESGGSISYNSMRFHTVSTTEPGKDFIPFSHDLVHQGHETLPYEVEPLRYDLELTLNPERLRCWKTLDSNIIPNNFALRWIVVIQIVMLSFIHILGSSLCSGHWSEI